MRHQREFNQIYLSITDLLNALNQMGLLANIEISLDIITGIAVPYRSLSVLSMCDWKIHESIFR